MQYTNIAKQVLTIAENEAKQLQHNYVGTEHILVALIKEERGVASQVLLSCDVEAEEVLRLIDKLVAPQGGVQFAEPEGYTPKAEKVFEVAEKEAINFQSSKIGTEHILIGILRESDCAGARLINTLGISVQKLFGEIIAAMGDVGKAHKNDFANIKAANKRGLDNTPILNQYSRDLTEMAKRDQLDPVVGRETEIQRVIQILSRRMKNNPCLIGEPGVGKTAIAEGIAQRIAAGNIPATVKDKRVVTLDIAGMVAGSKYRGEFEERIKKVLKEVRENGNILLFIDELHTIIGAGGAEGAIDASNILKPSLSRGEIQLIGATTIEEYRKYIEKDAALERRFQPVYVEEPSEKETLEILRGLRPKYEEHHKIKITDESLEAAVKLSCRYINDRFLPDKAIDLIDEGASRMRIGGFEESSVIKALEKELKDLNLRKEQLIQEDKMKEAEEAQKEYRKKENRRKKLLATNQNKDNGSEFAVTENTIADVVASWTKIPVQKIAEEETQRLKKLEKILHERVIGQEEAVSVVAKAVKRGRVGLKNPNRPVGSFLFLGPTGVGKTELSKALAEAVFGNEKTMIRVDMSEYMEKHSVSKIIGSPPGYVGYDEGGQISEKVRRNPYSVLLFDEIEKAHPDVFNILLQVLDDGHVTDAHGRKIDFKNTIIIMTSNAGAQQIIEPKKLGFATEDKGQQDYERMKKGVMEEVKRLFKPEFINRIDEIVVFHSLNKENIKKIVTIMSKELMDRCAAQMDIQLTIRDSVKNYIAENGYDRKYGARPLRRMIQSKIEDALAEAVLNGEVQTGNQVDVGIYKKDIKFYVK